MSNLHPSPEAEECAASVTPAPILQSLAARVSSLGALPIRRALPLRERRLVGPWCFLDRYGPLSFSSEKPMDVAPHPHIGLQTVSWLLEGEIVHHDSIGSEALVRPGELSLMTAGSGIAHTEETPQANSGKLNGVQLWVALPDAARNGAPAFHHYRQLPVMEERGGLARIIMGQDAGTNHFSPLIAADLTIHRNAVLEIPLDPSFEHALLVLEGEATLGDQRLIPDTLYYLGQHRSALALGATAGARCLLIGGTPLKEPVLMWWNFVARSNEELEAARRDWESHQRFAEVKAYRGPRLDAPTFVPRPVR
ncbi:MAG: pirin family protein [Bryobacteraceae bacterium]